MFALIVFFIFFVKKTLENERFLLLRRAKAGIIRLFRVLWKSRKARKIDVFGAFARATWENLAVDAFGPLLFFSKSLKI